MDTPRVNVALALVLACWLSACSLAPDSQRPAAPMPSAVTEAGYGPDAAARAPGQTVDITAPGWRDFFKDAQLQALLDEGLRRNRDLKLAVLAVAEARAQYGVQRAERLPQLSLDGSDTVSGSFYDQPKDKFAPMLTIPAFELDFFGRVKNLSGAALERYLASEEAARAAQISLVAQIAQSWADCAGQGKPAAGPQNRAELGGLLRLYGEPTAFRPGLRAGAGAGPRRGGFGQGGFGPAGAGSGAGRHCPFPAAGQL
jgi:hypothetical protein